MGFQLWALRQREICIAWDDPSMLILQVVQKITQFVHCIIDDKVVGHRIGFTIVYGLHTVQDRKTLWPDLLCINQHMHITWCVIGYFNVLETGDRVNGNKVITYETHNFSMLLDHSDIGEYNFCWLFFSLV